MFKLVADFKPAGDQPKAIASLIQGIKENQQFQVLLGATGTGKTYTIANVIAKINKPTLILSHNKTLAMQLYGELKGMFPENLVEYFVSNFDFYQPEAYMPKTDTYIDKTAKSNSDIEMMRLSAMNALVTRKDVIVVASVAAIYGAQDPDEYKKSFFKIRNGQKVERKALLYFLVNSGYTRNDLEIRPGMFTAKGDVIKLAPSWTDEFYLRIDLFDDDINEIAKIDVLTGKVIERYQSFTIFPAQDYITSKERLAKAITRIEAELIKYLEVLKANNQLLEYQRIEQRTNHDLEALQEFGICSGIENYSRHLDLRDKDVPPYTLIDYFGDDFVTIIDESHIYLPQVRGMFNTDQSRKQTLVNYGFRLPSALDNRPLNFTEFMNKLKTVIYTSATPGDFELNQVNYQVTEQIIRPTGLVDPTIVVKPTINQIDDIVENILMRKENCERVLITTLTIRQAEDLTSYLQERNIQVAYLHSELKTLDRSKILLELRKGVYDAVVGINLLREGLDIPEVSLICILEANKQGFLRDARSLIQTIGRTARNVNGNVIMYADTISDAMQKAMVETLRRRNVQIAYNKEHNIIPQTIKKKIDDSLFANKLLQEFNIVNKRKSKDYVATKTQIINDLRKEMLVAAKDLQFERAAQLRDLILELETE
ncbi:excinuclease ABC subunit UvrB [Spiroplasma endosymbiont of 'Nebria riversi']|uniref:excinuclease ABC subunit UvrB n=1 Tax=Spiroplasma endosymbiont of 'Nebria riversi' TaxID=2792084 RepID=UPI001C05040A|nr:excinuclease ABC subunit UvrB [Spiroplasma endosymbiont of 'Nebria riversi']